MEVCCYAEALLSLNDIDAPSLRRLGHLPRMFSSLSLIVLALTFGQSGDPAKRARAIVQAVRTVVLVVTLSSSAT